MDASRKLGFSAKQTMKVAQRLYEGVDIGGETVGLITYMRTDGVQIVPEAVAQIRSTSSAPSSATSTPRSPATINPRPRTRRKRTKPSVPTDPKRTPDSVRRASIRIRLRSTI